MNVSITPELEKFVAEKVASGRYNSASELIREALRLLETRDALHAKRIAAMDKFIQVGIDSADPTEGMSDEEAAADQNMFWAELDQIIEAAGKTHG